MSAVRLGAVGLTDLIGAVYAIAVERGAWLARLDALQSQIVRHVDIEAKPWWANARCERIHGQLRYESAIADELATKGVRIWTNRVDMSWRIVSDNWLTAHADIRAYVAGPKIPGRVCRFCRIVELPTSDPLTIIAGHRPGPLDKARPLTLGSVYTHEQCAAAWSRWVEIAQRYDTQEAAQAADREAGRVSKVPPAPEVPVLEHKAPEGFHHMSTGEGSGR